MISKTSSQSSNADAIITFHQVTNKIDDSFVGLKIRNNRIDFYYPETYDIDNSSFENSKKDILSLLSTISIAKTHSNTNIKIESTFSNNKALPLLSFLWIIHDFLKHGFYINREIILKKNQRGKVDWKRTINGQPIISQSNVIYPDLVVSVKDELDNILVEIHKYCVKKSLDFLGWLFKINNTKFINTPKVNDSIRKLYISVLNKELNKTYDDLKKERLSHMLSIVEGLSNDQDNNEIVYGVDSYAYIFERMINSIFGNRDTTKFNPSANWYLKNDGYKPFKSSDLRPDTILIKDNIAYVLDSKFYRFGFTCNKEDLPETTSIQKQITYGDFIKTNKMGEEVEKIRNAFLIPYNKNHNRFNYSNILEYIGYSQTDYRKGTEDHELIHTFLIDLKYVVDTWNKKNHKGDIDNLVNEIEKIQKTRIKEEKEKEYVNNIVKIKEGQSFQGSVLSTFYATRDNLKLKEALENKQILYVDGYFVINDKKYVNVDKTKKHLTQYALHNMDECCLAFDNVNTGPENEMPFEFCKKCDRRKRTESQGIKISDKHNQRIYLRAKDDDIDRVMENITDSLELRSKLSGSFSYNLNVLMEENGFDSDNSLNKESHIYNQKIAKLRNGSARPTVQECVALCAAFELTPIVAHHFLHGAGYELEKSTSEQLQFYNFLITYCYGETLQDRSLKIVATNHADWQIP